MSCRIGNARGEQKEEPYLRATKGKTERMPKRHTKVVVSKEEDAI